MAAEDKETELSLLRMEAVGLDSWRSRELDTTFNVSSARSLGRDRAKLKREDMMYMSRLWSKVVV